jgi:phytanoyl-CoA hydroxylase
LPAEPKLHPLSAGFRWEDRTAPLRRLSGAERAAFNRDGFIKVEHAFTPVEIAAVTAAIDPLEAEGEEKLRAAGGTVSIATADEITFTTHIVRKSAVLKAFAAHPFIKDVCHDLLGDEVRLYWDQSVYKKTALKREFPWHQDNGYTFIEPQQYLTFWLPLVDVDTENGCPWIAPGKHRLGTLDHWTTPIGYKCLEDVPDAVAVPARAGDAIIFSSLSPHRTGPNLKTGTVRKAYILQYAHDGSIATHRDGRTAPQDHPERQFKILSASL